MERSMIENLFRDENGWPKGRKVIAADGFDIDYLGEDFLKEVRFMINEKCIAAIDYFHPTPLYIIGDYIGDSQKPIWHTPYRLVKMEVFMDFMVEEHQNIAEWMLFNL